MLERLTSGCKILAAAELLSFKSSNSTILKFASISAAASTAAK